MGMFTSDLVLAVEEMLILETQTHTHTTSIPLLLCSELNVMVSDNRE